MNIPVDFRYAVLESLLIERLIGEGEGEQHQRDEDTESTKSGAVRLLQSYEPTQAVYASQSEGARADADGVFLLLLVQPQSGLIIVLPRVFSKGLICCCFAAIMKIARSSRSFVFFFFLALLALL